MLTILDHLPSGLLTTPPTELYRLIDGPTLINLPGHREPPLFVSVLLHGNETTGYFAIQELLKKYQNMALPRALSIFIGNVQAARHGERRLDNQVDYNRIWPHSEFTPQAEESKIMQQVIDEMRKRNVFVSIDIHNNTGYGVRNVDPTIAINATSNYWGSPDEPEEGVDYEGLVDYDPWVTSPIEEAGPG